MKAAELMTPEELIHEIRERYLQLEPTLNERQRRHWAAAEAIKLPHGGIAAISRALRISPNTIKKGMQEIAAGQIETTSSEELRVRKTGGGRKPANQVDDTPKEI